MDRVRKKNIIVMLAAAILCLINKRIRAEISIDCIRWFMCCYFNDIVGAIAFAAYCNLVFSFSRFSLNNLWKIELLILLCGLFWEFITPLYRKDTVTDLWDIAAYMIGGVLYWLIAIKISGRNILISRNDHHNLK